MRHFQVGTFAVLTALLADPGATAAQQAVPIEEMVDLLRQDPVSCLGPDGDGGCTSIGTSMLANASRGIETNVTSLEAEPGIYVLIMTSSNFEVGRNGFCYPNISSDILGSQVLITDTLSAAGSPNVQPAAPEGKEFVTSMLLQPMVNMLGSGRYCVQYFIPGDRTRSDVFFVRSYIDGEPMDDGDLVRLFPIESMDGLSLIPTE